MRIPPHEQGFTVVEVIIAILLMACVGSAIALAAVGGSSASAKTKFADSMVQALRNSEEDVTSDLRWMDSTACATECDISGYIRAKSLDLEDVDGVAAIVAATASGIDSELDGVAPNDEDGVVPDYFRISIELRANPELAARYRVPVAASSRRLVTTIDRRGEQQRGALVVEVCSVTNQRDERIVFQGCAPTGVSGVKMQPCPTVNPLPRCITAWNMVAGAPSPSASAPSPFVSMKRVPANALTFTISNGVDTFNSGSAKLENGHLVFENIPASEYRIDGLPASYNGTPRWFSKELPTSHGVGSIPKEASVLVEPGTRSRALVMFAPDRVGSGIDMRFKRRTREYHLAGPFEKTEVVKPEGTPVERYFGGNAAEQCAWIDEISAIFASTFSCRNVVYGVPSANCATVYLQGWYRIFEPAGGYYTDSNGDEQVWATSPDPAYENNRFSKRDVNGQRYYQFCMFVEETNWNTYYTTVAPPQIDWPVGAAQAANYYTEPRPDYRTLKLPASPYVDQCTVQRKESCSVEVDNLPAGLNSGLIVPGEYAGANATNQVYEAFPSWIWQPIWVQPDGSIVDYAGVNRPPNVVVQATGEGECYWTSVRFSGRFEAPQCGPCNPLWTPTTSYPGACAVNTKTRWQRIFTETGLKYSITTGAPEEDMGVIWTEVTGPKTTVHTPPWRCSSPTTITVATRNGATCRAFEGGNEDGPPAQDVTSDKTKSTGREGATGWGGAGQ